MADHDMFGIMPYMDLTKKITGYHPVDDYDYRTNPWNNYFDQPVPSDDELFFAEALADGGLRPEATNDVNVQFHDIAKKFLHIKQHILDKVDNFYKQHFTDDIVGIHIRGTDSFYDRTRPHPPLGFYRDLIKEKFDNVSKIFLCTDSRLTLEWMKKEFPEKIVHYDSDLVSFEENMYNTAMICDSYKNGEDVLIESILLSKCNRLIRTISNVSSFAIILNPYISNHLADLRFYNDRHLNRLPDYKNLDLWKNFYDKDLEPSTMSYHLARSHDFEKKKLDLCNAHLNERVHDYVLDFYYK